jgi:hypothetical protein
VRSGIIISINQSNYNMKTTKTIFLATLMVLLCIPFNLNAQSDQKMKLYSVHEDDVKPSMLKEYENSIKEFKDNLTKHSIQDMNFLTVMTDDLKYMYVMPLENMAQLDNQMFATLAQKMGPEEMNNMFDKMDKTYYSHKDYIIMLDEEMSYMPDGISQTQEGMNYRVFHYYYTTPENHANLAKAGKAIKDLYASKKSKSHYRIYRSGFGTDESYFMVAVSAKDPVHLAEMQKANSELLGAEGDKLWYEALKYTSRLESKHGWIRDELSYKANKANSEMKTAKKN